MGQQVPLWVAVVIAVATPLLAFAGVIVGQLLLRRGALEQDVRWRREETMRLLRWAAELALDADPGRSAVGVAALDGLQQSELIRRHDQPLVTAVLQAVLEPVVDDYHEDDIVLEEE